MQKELQKPLGQDKPANPKKRGLSASAFLSLLTLIAVLGIGAYLYLKPAPEPVVVAAREVDSITGKTGTQQGRRVEPGQPAMEEMQPSGTMVEPKPQPKAPKAPAAEAVRQTLRLAHLPDPKLVEQTSLGVIPRLGKDGTRPMDVYSREPETSGNFSVARVVIVVGGLGISQTTTQRAINELPSGVTLAFAPYGNSLMRWMQQARKTGHEILLQVPMEPFDYPQNDPGLETLRVDVPKEENIANLHWAMSRITNYVGIMNFLGGQLLSNDEALRPIMYDIAQRGLLFLDDGSIKNTDARRVAGETMLPYAQADLYLDENRAPQAIHKALVQLSNMAKRKGLAIGVANAFPESIDVITQYIQKLNDEGIELTPLSAVIEPDTN